MSSDVRVCTTVDEFDRLRGPWTELTRNAGARSLFLTWEWLNACSLSVAKADQLAIVCVYEGRDLVAAVPLVRRCARYYGIPVTETVFLGDPLSDRQFFLDGSDAGTATSRIWQFLSTNPFRSTLLRLEQVPEGSMTVARGKELISGLEVEVASSLLYVPLKSSWADFELTLDSKFRREMRSRTRVFDAFGPWDMTHLLGAAVKDHIREIARVELSSTRGAQGRALFRDADQAACLAMFVDTVAGTDIEPVLSLLRIKGRIAAYALTFLYDRTLHAYNWAFLPEYRKGSPGKFVVHQVFRYAHGLGASEFDLLRGDYFMKREWKPLERKNVRCALFSTSPKAQALRWAVFHVRPRLKRWFANG